MPAWVSVICRTAPPATAGYRTDDYLYLPVGITARTRVASHGALSFNPEFDLLIHGWQKTRDSALGGGDVPPTTDSARFHYRRLYRYFLLAASEDGRCERVRNIR